MLQGALICGAQTSNPSLKKACKEAVWLGQYHQDICCFDRRLRNTLLGFDDLLSETPSTNGDIST